MLPIHTILHPTDFSEYSRSAFLLACSLARDYGARLIVLHVVETPTATYTEGGLMLAFPEGWRKNVQAQLEAVRPLDPTITVEHLLAEGGPAEEILNAAREIRADLIVMGTHGRGVLGRLLMGSVAETVLRKAPCPVLTVKNPFPAAAPTVKEEACEMAAS
jgi:nucleotide-binding universal stress UspA family protein